MRTRRTALVLTVTLSLLAVVGVTAQLPDGEEPSGVPTPRENVVPGDLDLGRVNKDAAPFPEDSQRMAAPATVDFDQNTFSVSPSLVGSVPVPAYGYIHQYGAFQITRSTAEGMFMLSANLPFPDGRRTVDFYHAPLTFFGKHVDRSTGISGYVYFADIGAPVNDRRYFLFGDRNLNVNDPNSNGVRWVVYYNSNGKRTYHTTARFYRP